MANTRSGNTWYVDTAHSSSSDDLAAAVIVTMVVLTSSGASGRITLADRTTGQTKIDLKLAAEDSAATGDSRVFDFSNSPITFLNGIKVSTLTTAVATLIGTEAGRGNQ